MMVQQNKIDEYLLNLFIKTMDAPRSGYIPRHISQLLNLTKQESNLIEDELYENKYIVDSETIGGHIIINTPGRKYLTDLSKRIDFKIIKFLRCRHIFSEIDVIFHEILYEISDMDLNIIGNKLITIGITDVLGSSWGYYVREQQGEEIQRVCYYYAWKYIKTRLLSNELNNVESYVLDTSNSSEINPEHKGKLLPLSDNIFVCITNWNKSEKESNEIDSVSNKINELIDIVNFYFHSKHNKNLIIITQARAMTALGMKATSQDALTNRIASLTQLATSLNNDTLRDITNCRDENIQSIKLLTMYLNKNNYTNTLIIPFLRNLNDLRQDFPIHTSTASKLAYQYFKLEYPIRDYNGTWNMLKEEYIKSLEELVLILKA